MSYQVLARKWRPRDFKELVGQEHVVRALVNALESQRLHHAFLFTGTRGVGKTTIARILAKSLNCEQGVSANPCGACAVCKSIDAGRFVDLIEVDAASRTKVEDTRELLENVQYAPSQGRYKVYLIDEVHMLSAHSFNALLKTLEEPPPHVKFLLATTDPQRLPVTILSRCLQFNLKRLPSTAIKAHLDSVLAQENIANDSAALALIARAAEGSMRDALSLLDQAVAFGGGRVMQDDVAAMLGTIDRRYLTRLLDALAAADASKVLAEVHALDAMAPDYQAVLADLISTLQRIALMQVVPDAADGGFEDAEEIRRLAGVLKPEDVQLFYQIALIGRRDLPLSPEPRGGFEMVLLRMLCFNPVGGQAPSPRPAGRDPNPARSVVPDRSETVTPAARVDAQRSTAPEQQGEWSTIVAQLKLKGMAQQLALNCALEKREGGSVYLILDAGHAQMRIKNAEERLQAALEAYYGEPVRLHIGIRKLDEATPARQRAEQQEERQQAAVEAINRDPNVRALCETFNAQVKPDSIRPVD